jgi:hypothetical protein
MVKPKKKRKGDSAQVAYSVVQDAIRLHRFLEEHAKDALKEQIAKTTTLLQISGSKYQFAEHFKSVFHGQTQINFDELLSDDFGN